MVLFLIIHLILLQDARCCCRFRVENHNLGGSDCLQSVRRTGRILRVKPEAFQAQMGTGIGSSAGLYHLFKTSARNFFCVV